MLTVLSWIINATSKLLGVVFSQLGLLCMRQRWINHTPFFAMDQYLSSNTSMMQMYSTVNRNKNLVWWCLSLRLDFGKHVWRLTFFITFRKFNATRCVVWVTEAVFSALDDWIWIRDSCICLYEKQISACIDFLERIEMRLGFTQELLNDYCRCSRLAKTNVLFFRINRSITNEESFIGWCHSICIRNIFQHGCWSLGSWFSSYPVQSWIWRR